MGTAKKACNREESNRAEKRGRATMWVGEGGQPRATRQAENTQKTINKSRVERHLDEEMEQESGEVRSQKLRRDFF